LIREKSYKFIGVIFITEEMLNSFKNFLDSYDIFYALGTFFVIIFPRQDLT